jgi:hypothetical protein
MNFNGSNDPNKGEKAMSYELTSKLVGITRTVKTSVKADQDSPKEESISVFLDIDYSECTFEDVLSFASSNRVIVWANGSGGRKAIGKLKPGQHIVVKASSPGVKPPQSDEDFVTEMAAKSGMSVEQYLNMLQSRIASKKV